MAISHHFALNGSNLRCTPGQLNGPAEPNASTEPAGSAGQAQPAGLAARLMELSRRIATEPVAEPVEPILEALELACSVVPGARWASITRRRNRPNTIAATSQVAEAVDGCQYDTGGGPCLEALATSNVVISDFDAETRWPNFVARVAHHGPARAALSYPLVAAGHAETSLNFYTDEPAVLDGMALHPASLAAAGVGLALTAVEEHQRAEHLEIALATSRQVGAAIGILMQSHKITDAQAFDLLRTTSQHSHRKLRDIADDVLLTGTLPQIVR